MRTIATVLAFILSASLVGCGGSSGGQAPACGTMLNPSICGAPAGSTGITSLNLSLTDSSGAATTQVSPSQTGTLSAVVTDVTGAAVSNVAVTFTTSDKTGSFVPSSGTALTDSSGVARVGLPPGTQAGGFTVTASATMGKTTATGTAGYSVTFPTLSLSALTITPATLSAGGNASISVTVSSGASPYTSPLAVAFTSPCVAAGKATVGSPVLSQNGIATASYSDKGCGVADVITATVALGDSTVTRSGTLNVLPASAGSVQFVSADTTNIALRGTGGIGRQEFATLKFKVSDTTGTAVAGTLVDFVFADTNTGRTVGGLQLQPAFATSAPDGTVTTLVADGVIPTSVRVIATIRGTTPPIATLSNVLVVSTGVPDQKHFSLATETGNCEGRDIDQHCSWVTVTMGDHFGNPVPDGTAVNFTANGGNIDASCITGNLPPQGPPTTPGVISGTTPTNQTTNSKVGPGSGACSVRLRSASPRTASGRVVVLAYAAGEEDFFDANGNNVCDGCDTTSTAPGAEFTPANDKSLDVFRDDSENFSWTAGEPCIGPNSNGTCSSREATPQYNGVLRNPRVVSPQTLYVSGQLVQTFSGSAAEITFITTPNLVCPVGRTANVQFTVTDTDNVVGGVRNVMPKGTKIGISALYAGDFGPVAPSSFEVNNVVLAIAGTMPRPVYTAAVGCSGFGTLTVTVTTPSGAITTSAIPIVP